MKVNCNNLHSLNLNSPGISCLVECQLKCLGYSAEILVKYLIYFAWYQLKWNISQLKYLRYSAEMLVNWNVWNILLKYWSNIWYIYLIYFAWYNWSEILVNWNIWDILLKNIWYILLDINWNEILVNWNVWNIQLKLWSNIWYFAWYNWSEILVNWNIWNIIFLAKINWTICWVIFWVP